MQSPHIWIQRQGYKTKLRCKRSHNSLCFYEMKDVSKTFQNIEEVFIKGSWSTKAGCVLSFPLVFLLTIEKLFFLVERRHSRPSDDDIGERQNLANLQNESGSLVNNAAGVSEFTLTDEGKYWIFLL